MGKNKSKFDFDSTNLLFYIYSKFKILFVVSFLAAVISAIISLSITPKFKSSVVMFPVSSTAISHSLLSTLYNPPKGGLMGLGEEEEAEQLMQVLKSEEIMNRVINKFRLMQHYEIDSSSRYPRTTLYNEYKSNFTFRQTEYLSVIVDVLDKDPVMAANMANYVAALVDTVMNNMRRDRSGKAYIIVKNEYLALSERIKTLEDSLSLIRRKGINDYESQSRVFNKGYVDALLKGQIQTANIIEKKLDILSRYGGIYVSIRDFLQFEQRKLADLNEKYAQAKVEYELNLPHKYIVDSAKVSEKKAYPKRSLIVVVSVVSTFLLTLIVLVSIDNIKKYL